MKAMVTQRAAYESLIRMKSARGCRGMFWELKHVKNEEGEGYDYMTTLLLVHDRMTLSRT